MSFLAGLHGTLAAILICSLLLVDEAGIPLPIAPNEGLLLLSGVLVASGAFPLWVIFPAAFVAMSIGMLAGYGWARTVGQAGLRTIAERVRAAAVYDRAQARLQSASAWGIAGSRLVPGIRPYATLVSGAAEVSPATFLLGAIPALLLWEIIWILAGMLMGLPIALLLGRFEKLVLRGVVLIALGCVAWLAIRHATADERCGVVRLRPRFRASLALAVDATLVGCVVGGLFAVGRRVVNVTADGWIELVVAAVILILLLIAGRSAQTPGETLFETEYWHHSAARSP
jgi:membrane protein DedA with SNARE-associated domain